MRKGIVVIFVVGIVVALLSSCRPRPFACFTTDVDMDSIRVDTPITFYANCSSNATNYYWEFYDNEDSSFFGYSVTMRFHQPGQVKVILLVANSASTSATTEFIDVKP